jgi:subtilisin-like proprotein convertase family protein
MNKQHFISMAVAIAAFASATTASATFMYGPGTADGSALLEDTAAPVVSTILVSDNFLVTDVNVEVNLEHTWVGDLILELTGPNSTVVRLMGDGPDGSIGPDGSSGDNLTGTVFDDEALASITGVDSFDAPFTGSWIPREALSAFDGINAAGGWVLTATDDESGDVGTFLNWSLTFEGREIDGNVPVPGTLLLLALGAAGLARRRQ